MRLFNRKPKTVEPIYVDGMPYMVLSMAYDNGTYAEAVDPFGNQVVLHKYAGKWRMWDPTYLPKESLESMRRVNPKITDKLDTNYEGPDSRFPGGMTVYDERKRLDDDTWFQRISEWKKQPDGGFRLINAYNYVVTEGFALRMVDSPGGKFQKFSDPVSGTEGYREERYSRGTKSWDVVEFVQTPNANDFFAKPPAPPARRK